VDLSLARRCQAPQEVWNQWQEVGKTIRLAAKDPNRDAPRKVLLVFQPPIHGYKGIEASSLGHIEQDAIFLPARPASGRCGTDDPAGCT
jgi:hypothetical protein